MSYELLGMGPLPSELWTPGLKGFIFSAVAVFFRIPD